MTDFEGVGAPPPLPTIHVSGAEPAYFHSLGPTSNLPEEYGADFFWESRLGRVGVQRKACPGDFLASMQDRTGRLNKEFLQMQSLDVKVLLLEGEQRMRWGVDGQLMAEYGAKRYTIDQHRNYLAGVSLFRGVQVQRSMNQQDTVRFLQAFYKWTQADEHVSLDYRPAAQTDGFWDTLDNTDFQAWFLQALPLVGPKRARRIIETLGFPFKLTVSMEELMEVHGIGAGLAQRIWDMFHKLEGDVGAN